MENLAYYAACIVAVIIGIYLFKRFVGCLVRSVITIVFIAILVYIYVYYLS